MALRPERTYKINITGSASTALLLSQGESRRQYKIRAKGTDVIYKFGDETVVASNTVTDSQYAEGNHDIADGAIELGDIKRDSPSEAVYISAMAEDGASTGTLFVTVGYGEKV